MPSASTDPNQNPSSTRESSSSSKTRIPSGIPRPIASSLPSGNSRTISNSTRDMSMSVESTPQSNRIIGAYPSESPTSVRHENSAEAFTTPASRNSGADIHTPSARHYLLGEMNRIAISRGKAPIQALRWDKNLGQDVQELVGPEDSISQVKSGGSEKWSYPMQGWSEPACNTTRPLPSVVSNASQIEKRVRDYKIELRRRYVLWFLRKYDLHLYSTTLINPVDIKDKPQLVQKMYPIQDAEVDKIRTIYPEPFSENDPSSARRPSENSRDGRGSGAPNGGVPPGMPGGSDGGDSDDNHSGGRRGGGGFPGGSGPPGNPDRPSNPGVEDYDDISKRGDIGDQSKGVRYTSVDPTLVRKKEWSYGPTPLSEEELLKVAFKTFEDLIVKYLYCEPVDNGSVQKTLLQSLPKPGEYRGEDDLTFFGSWFRDLVSRLRT
ncbi:hypothetical protein V5O48_012736 [Marasmius crinis-equi]|uniref:Uncharacterized protein n=1 Tax=Marasmius crinis-equi TaxID=585013 RepID=A0ABR3F275_9AGAR